MEFHYSVALVIVFIVCEQYKASERNYFAVLMIVYTIRYYRRSVVETVCQRTVIVVVVLCCHEVGNHSRSYYYIKNHLLQFKRLRIVFAVLVRFFAVLDKRVDTYKAQLISHQRRMVCFMSSYCKLRFKLFGYRIADTCPEHMLRRFGNYLCIDKYMFRRYFSVEIVVYRTVGVIYNRNRRGRSTV